MGLKSETLWFFQCDGKDCGESVGCQSDSQHTTREFAEKEGWTLGRHPQHSGYLSLCPKCQKKPKRVKKPKPSKGRGPSHFSRTGLWWRCLDWKCDKQKSWRPVLPNSEDSVWFLERKCWVCGSNLETHSGGGEASLKKPGALRIKLVEILKKEVGGLELEPEDLGLENPMHLSQDALSCCNWFARGTCYGEDVTILGYGSMKDCVRLGVVVNQLDPNIEFEVKGGRRPKARKAQGPGH